MQLLTVSMASALKPAVVGLVSVANMLCCACPSGCVVVGAELIKSTPAIVGSKKTPRVFWYLQSTLKEIRYLQSTLREI
jgi:hypothetical protein